MLQTFTRNDLVRFIYRETSLVETLALREALRKDFFLREAYEELHSGYRQLPKAGFLPSVATISSILAYSAETAWERQH